MEADAEAEAGEQLAREREPRTTARTCNKKETKQKKKKMMMMMTITTIMTTTRHPARASRMTGSPYPATQAMASHGGCPLWKKSATSSSSGDGDGCWIPWGKYLMEAMYVCTECILGIHSICYKPARACILYVLYLLIIIKKSKYRDSLHTYFILHFKLIRAQLSFFPFSVCTQSHPASSIKHRSNSIFSQNHAHDEMK